MTVTLTLRFRIALILSTCAAIASASGSVGNSCKIQVIDSRTNATLLTVTQLATIDSVPASTCSEKKYLIATKLTDACQSIRPISELSSNTYNARSASSETASSGQRQCWICLVISGGCDLNTKINYARDGGCNYLFISIQNPEDSARISQELFGGGHLKSPFQISISFINSTDGESLKKFAHPKRYKWKISSNCTKSSLPDVPSSTGTLSWSVKILAGIFTLWLINRVNPVYANNILQGLRMSFWPIFVLCTCILLLLGKTGVVLHGTDTQSILLQNV